MVSSLLRHAVGQALRTPHALRFAAASRRPGRAQADLLREILARGAGSELGTRLGLGGISGPADYARRVPTMTAAQLSAYATRLMNGERNLLTPDPPVFYAATTGTSGAHKVVPVTDRYRADFQKTVHVALSHMFLRFPAAFTSKVLYFVAARRLSTAADGHDVGYMSGYNYSEMPRAARALYAWPYEMFAVPDLAARAYLAVRYAVLGDVSIIAGVFPLGIVQLLRDLETHAETLVRDLRDGTLTGAPGLTPEELARFRVAPRPDLAARLERAARAPVEEKVAEALPRLRLCYCWTTSTAGLYIPELARRLGPRVAVRDAIYAASEGWCNVTLGDEDPGGPAAVSSVYLELIPEEELDAPEPRTLPVEALEDGRRYGVVVTTSAGLYRYAVGDVIEVCGRHNATPRIRFVRKTGAASNLVGELLDETHVTEAVPAALDAAHLRATWFALVADASGALPGYDLHLELAPGAAPPADLAALGADVDRRLVAGALTYGDKLGTRLRPIRVVLVPAGRWEAWRRARLASGTGDAQLKTVHLVPAGAPPEIVPR